MRARLTAKLLRRF